jgi:hypothetical protein
MIEIMSKAMVLVTTNIRDSRLVSMGFVTKSKRTTDGWPNDSVLIPTFC